MALFATKVAIPSALNNPEGYVPQLFPQGTRVTDDPAEELDSVVFWPRLTGNANPDQLEPIDDAARAKLGLHSVSDGRPTKKEKSR